MTSSDLEQIDLLVQPGSYADRADFVRTAVRAQIAAHGEIAPIVDSAADVVRVFRSLPLEFLVLGDQLIRAPR